MISTHVLDTAKGKAASGISVKLRIREGDQWKEMAHGKTDQDGRLKLSSPKAQGVYQLLFEVEDYLKSSATDYFYLTIPVVFQIQDTARNYHVPLLLSPFGYSTYRGT